MVQQLQTELTIPPWSTRKVKRLTCGLGRVVKTSGLTGLHQKQPSLSSPISNSWLNFIHLSPDVTPLGEPYDTCITSPLLVLSHNHFTSTNHSSLRNPAWPLDITPCVHFVSEKLHNKGTKSTSEMVTFFFSGFFFFSTK